MPVIKCDGERPRNVKADEGRKKIERLKKKGIDYRVRRVPKKTADTRDDTSVRAPSELGTKQTSIRLRRPVARGFALCGVASESVSPYDEIISPRTTKLSPIVRVVGLIVNIIMSRDKAAPKRGIKSSPAETRSIR